MVTRQDQWHLPARKCKMLVTRTRTAEVSCSLAAEVVALADRNKKQIACSLVSMRSSFRVPTAHTALVDGKQEIEPKGLKGGQLSGNRSLSVAFDYAVQHLFNVAHQPASSRRSVEWGWMQQVEEVDSWRGSRRSRAANSHDETLS